ALRRRPGLAARRAPGPGRAHASRQPRHDGDARRRRGAGGARRAPQPGRSAIDRAAGRAGAEAARAGRRVAHRSGAAPAPADRRDGLGAMVSMSIPLVYKYKYDAAAGEANARMTTAQAELRRLQDRIRRDVQQAFLRARIALAQRDLFVSTHIPQAEQALRASQVSYETGKVDFLSLVDSV